MGTLAQEILRKMHGYEQRNQIKQQVDDAEAKVKQDDPTREEPKKDDQAKED